MRNILAENGVWPDPTLDGVMKQLTTDQRAEAEKRATGVEAKPVLQLD
jgi:hypothetical protein